MDAGDGAGGANSGVPFTVIPSAILLCVLGSAAHWLNPACAGTGGRGIGGVGNAFTGGAVVLGA